MVITMNSEVMDLGYKNFHKKTAPANFEASPILAY